MDISIFRPQRMYLGVATALIAHDQPLLKLFASITPEAYSNRHPPEFDLYHDCVGVLLKYAEGKKKQALLKSQESIARWSGAGAKLSKPMRETLLPLLEGGIAVFESKPDELTSALNCILVAHEKNAKRGESSEEMWTLLSLDALVLAAIAQREGMQLNITDRYMPVELIG